MKSRESGAKVEAEVKVNSQEAPSLFDRCQPQPRLQPPSDGAASAILGGEPAVWRDRLV